MPSYCKISGVPVHHKSTLGLAVVHPELYSIGVVEGLRILYSLHEHVEQCRSVNVKDLAHWETVLRLVSVRLAQESGLLAVHCTCEPLVQPDNEEAEDTVLRFRMLKNEIVAFLGLMSRRAETVKDKGKDDTSVYPKVAKIHRETWAVLQVEVACINNSVKRDIEILGRVAPNTASYQTILEMTLVTPAELEDIVLKASKLYSESALRSVAWALARLYYSSIRRQNTLVDKKFMADLAEIKHEFETVGITDAMLYVMQDVATYCKIEEVTDAMRTALGIIYDKLKKYPVLSVHARLITMKAEREAT